MLGTSTSGYVRATGLAPRDSAPDRRPGRSTGAPSLLSPNDDGANDELVVAARFSERVTATLTVRNAAGNIVKSQSVDGDIVRFAWDLDNDAGNTVKDGAYTWTLRATDDWGNAGTSASGGVHARRDPARVHRQPASTAGLDGWMVSPVDVAISATDALSGVRSIS